MTLTDRHITTSSSMIDMHAAHMRYYVDICAVMGAYHLPRRWHLMRRELPRV
jgi:hypothetical protein